MNMDIKDKIKIINEMDLKVAVPPRYTTPRTFKRDSDESIKIETIHIPSLIQCLLWEIEKRDREIEDVKKATKILLNIKAADIIEAHVTTLLQVIEENTDLSEELEAKDALIKTLKDNINDVYREEHDMYEKMAKLLGFKPFGKNQIIWAKTQEDADKIRVGQSIYYYVEQALNKGDNNAI